MQSVCVQIVGDRTSLTRRRGFPRGGLTANLNGVLVTRTTVLQRSRSTHEVADEPSVFEVTQDEAR
jgi:hypothetical protein